MDSVHNNWFAERLIFVYHIFSISMQLAISINVGRESLSPRILNCIIIDILEVIIGHA